MKYKIIVDKQSRTNPSNEKKEYEIDIEELHCRGDIYDSLVITKDEDYVMRRLQKNEYNVLNILEQPIKEPLENINIELFEGDNYIYLLDMVGNKICAEYLVKSDFTDLYVTKNEMNSAINETAEEIEIAVNQKLTEYSTSEDLDQAVTELSGTITAKAGEINAEVSKKVNKTDYTKANIILKINDNTSQAKINADVIELSANDILNLLAGNTINLTSKNIVISSTNFNVDKTGKVTCNNADIKGKIESSNGKIGGWTINEQGLSNGIVFIKNNGASTLYTVADLIVIRNYIMGVAGFELPPNMINHYDLNNDGKVNSLDYTILQNLVGISMN